MDPQPSSLRRASSPLSHGDALTVEIGSSFTADRDGGEAAVTTRRQTLSPELLRRVDAYWRAANYVSVGQIYLYDNPLLKKPLELSDVKPLVVGHWGSTPGQNFIYVHLNRVIKKYDMDMFYVAGPGHGGPALVGNEALVRCTEGIGIWGWASNDRDAEPDVVMACCGDTPPLEILAAVSILRRHLPDLKVRVVNIVDLMKLEPAAHNLSDADYDSIFTKDKHIIFGSHGYPWLIHRFHLVQDVIGRVPRLGAKGDYLKDDEGQPDRARTLHRHARPRHAGSPRLDVG